MAGRGSSFAAALILLLGLAGAVPALADEKKTEEAQETGEQIDNSGARQVGIRSRVELWNEFKNKQGSAIEDTTVLRIDYAFLKYAFLRTEIPFVYADPNDGTTPSDFGLGDVMFRVGSRFFQAPYFLWSGIFDVTLNTAQGELGRGKTVLTPGMEGTATLRPIHSTYTVFIQYNKDVAGDSSRAPVNYLRYRFTLDTDIAQTWVTTVEPFLYQDFNAKAVGMVMELEVVRKFGKHWRPYVRGGFHLFGENLRGMYDWLTQAGIRYMF